MQCLKFNELFFSDSDKELQYEFYEEDNNDKIYYDPDSFSIKLLDKFDNVKQELELSDTTRVTLGIYKFTIEIPRYTTNEIMFLEIISNYNSKETTDRLQFDVIFANKI